MSDVPPGNPRGRRWQAPPIGSQFERLSDDTIWTVKNLDRKSRHVCFYGPLGGKRKWVDENHLREEWRRVA